MAASSSASKFAALICVTALLPLSAPAVAAECTTPTTVLVEPWPAEWNGELFRNGSVVASLRSVELSFSEAGTVKNKKGDIKTNYIPEFRVVAAIAGIDGEISNRIGAVFNENVQKNCNVRPGYHGASVRAEGGRLHVDAGMQIELWSCTIFDVPCCSGWFRCGMCRQSIETRIAQVDPSVRGTVWLATTGDRRGVEITSDLRFDDNLSSDQKALITVAASLLGSVVGGPIGAIGGVVVVGKELDKYADLGFRGPLQRAERDFSTPTTGQLSIRAASFEDRGGERVVVLQQRGDGSISDKSAIELCSYFTVKAANAARKAQGITSVTIAKGDTLWDIADRVYGDGKYFQVLAYANPKTAKALWRGAVINVPEIDPLDTDPGVVRRGDTLWAMAVRMYGDGTQYPKLLERSRKKITDPDHIFPLWLLDVPEEPVQSPPLQTSGPEQPSTRADVLQPPPR